VGIIAYEMLLGEKGFRTECQSIYPTDAEIRKNEKATKWMNWHLRMEAKFRPLSEVDSTIPAGLSRLVERMTAKDLTRRYQDVASAISDLRSWQNLSQPESAPEDDDATLRAPEAVRQAKSFPAPVIQHQYTVLSADVIQQLHANEVAVWSWPTT